MLDCRDVNGKAAVESGYTYMHIYQVSRLCKKPAQVWERILKDIEDGKDFMSKLYSPLRRAILSEIGTPGSGPKILATGLSRISDPKLRETIGTKSRAAFDVFCEKVLPEIA
jgi:hypothetical protein